MTQMGTGHRVYTLAFVLGCGLLVGCSAEGLDSSSDDSASTSDAARCGGKPGRGKPGCGSGGSSSSTGTGGSTSSGGVANGGSGGVANGGSGGVANGGSGGVANGGSGGSSSGGSGGSQGPSECGDGIDNDGDGYVDWQSDLGCYGPGDQTEAARPRDQEDGFTTFDVGADSHVVYVSASGNDANDGSTPAKAVKTLTRGAALVRDGQNDFMLLRRGDTWRGQMLGRFKSGKDATHPLVIASYGDSADMPRIEVADHFIDHDGAARSFTALVGLHLVVNTRDPADPAFTGSGDGLLRYVGNGSHLLIEGCHFEYGGLIVQSYGSGVYQDVEFRRNVVERAYDAASCPNVGPSGMYSSHIERLTIEGNLFDHNGWNDEVPGACATMYNHNLYLNGNDLVVRDNIFSRASSMHIKLRSDTTGDMSGTLIENNYFVEGEIGVSIGGNTDVAGRFGASTIKNNVMSDIGRSQPTGRTLAWGIEVKDNDGLAIQGNYFLNQRKSGVTNSYAINLGGNSEKSVNVSQNLFYRIQGKSLASSRKDGHQSIAISNNTFVDPDQGAALIEHSGTFVGYTYTGNQYYASASSGSWFRVAGGAASLATWKTSSGESNAQAISIPSFSDPTRSIETYASSLGLPASIAGFIEAARLKNRLNYDPRFTANALNAYIREGFAR
jgi:hypothetical protein